ncbi:flavin-nucleotide-binding protein [Salinarchaeum sp. Harcht-Bsk1]|nr:flavin-nucleotide-binding protein [Salinarchaeum sp. Harcht-Bsk1]
MDALEIADFLDTQHTGVLAMGRDDVGYGIPLSFAYDEDGPYVYFRLAYADGGQKREFVEAADSVAFVVHDDTEEGWKSVVAEGPIETQSETTFDAQLIEATKQLDIPYFSVHDRPAEGLEFVIARIDVADLTGVIEVGSDR